MMTTPEQGGSNNEWPDESQDNWLVQTLRAMIPKNVWENAPTSITAWGYSALVFLTVVAVATSLAKGNLASLVLTIALMFGLFVALWAFSNMSRSPEPFWKTTGKIAGLVTIGSMIGLFCTILLYISLGVPVWMDRWFQPGMSIPPPADVKGKPGVMLRDPRPMAQSHHLQGGSAGGGNQWIAWTTSALAQEVNNSTGGLNRRTSVTVTWARNVQAGTNMEVSIRAKGQQGDFPASIIVPGQEGGTRFTGLKPGTVYEIRIVAEQRSRRSSPAFLFVATDADHLTLDRYAEFMRVYTGELSSDGTPEDRNGELIFSRFPKPLKNEPIQWIYRGSVRNGLPDGRGVIETDPEGCDSPICGTRCEAEFQAGKIVNGTCELGLALVYGRAHARGNKATEYNGTSHYSGGVIGAEKEASVFLGPFPIWFSGTGTLQARDREYDDVWEGTWQKGSLERGSIIGKNSGLLETGQEYAQRRCSLTLIPVKGKSIAGYGGKVTCISAELGEWRDGMELYRGFSTTFNDSVLSAHWYDHGDDLPLSPKNWNRFEPCAPEETWGLPERAGEPDSPDWKLVCERSDGPFECKLASRAVDVAVVASKPINAIPQIEFWTSGNARGGNTPIAVDDAPRTLKPVKKQNAAENYALAAELCGGSRLSNREQRQEIPLKGFCPKLAIMFNRLFTCSTPLQGKGIGEPDPSQFDPANFIIPRLSDDRKWLQFSMVRLNEGFYTKPDLVGNMSITISVGDTCETRYHLEFPMDATASYSYGIGQNIVTDEWSPVVLSYGVDQSMKWANFIYGKLAKPQFAQQSYKCYTAELEVTYFFKFDFTYRGRRGMAVYRLPISRTELPKIADLTPASEQEFAEAKARYEKRKEVKHITDVLPQEIALEFEKNGLPTNWRELR